MPASKSVVVGMSVAGGVAILVILAVLLYVFVPRKTSSGDAPSKCKGVPSVDGTSGAVTNFDKLLMPDGVTCGENVAMLNSLCLNTVCTNTDLCKSSDSYSYQTWDAYDAAAHKCVKVNAPTCEQQVCDAPYCQSLSVRPPTLPPLHKRTSSNSTCVNPSEAEVAAMCNKLADHQYVTPDCRVVTMEKVIEMNALPGVQNTTTVITGQMSVPRTGDAEALQYSYKLSGAGGTFTGVLTTSAPTDISSCGNADNMCFTYTINLLPGAVHAGDYTLTVFARPAWSDVNTMQSIKPASLSLVAPPVDPNVDAALNVKLSRQLASDLIQDGTILRQLLSPLPFQNPGLAMTIPPTLTVKDLKSVPPSETTGAGTADAFYMAACDPTICPLGGASSKLMSRALVFVAWPAVQPLSTTQCKGSTVQYAVRKNSAQGGASVIAPALATAFADLVQVGDHVTYTITTSQGTCKSQPVVLSIYIPPFSDTLCHSIPIAGGVLPPWMWSSNSGCVWYPDDGGAQDYYCAFEYMNPTHSLLDASGKVKLMLADQNNECKQVMPTYPQVTKPYAAPACNYSDHVTDVCFTGYTDPAMRQATCSPALPLGTDGTQSISNDGAFYDRLDRLNTFYGLHNTFTNASINPIQPAQQVALYNSYYHCGVQSDPERWGVTAGACAENDQACLTAVTNGACDTRDRNICLPWAQVKDSSNTFTQQRVCFGDDAFTNTSCCKPGQKYMFDYTVPKSVTGASRGSCQG